MIIDCPFFSDDNMADSINLNVHWILIVGLKIKYKENFLKNRLGGKDFSLVG